MERLEGIIIKGVGGLYSVETPAGVIACKARGIFRKDGVKPLVGDRVEVTVDGTGSAVSKIFERKNALNRPPVANIDRLVIISGAVSPAPGTLIIDRLTAACEKNGIEPVVAFSKCDLADVSRFAEIYRKAGFRSFVYSAVTGEGLDAFADVFDGGVSALTGNSGAGKSTLMNVLFPELQLETGDVSKKLGRGRHTTRAVELFRVGNGYIADTPGFSSLDLDGSGFIRRTELAECFSDFAPYRDRCRFTGCSHTAEKGCEVLRAVADGEICQSRHESYKLMYEEAKAVPDWMLDKKK